MGLESPGNSSPENKRGNGSEDLPQLEKDFNRMMDDLDDADEFLIMVTSQCDTPRLEKYLADNYDLLSDKGRSFILLSLRLKHARKSV